LFAIADPGIVCHVFSASQTADFTNPLGLSMAATLELEYTPEPTAQALQ
jgi:hypothetical protein